MPNMDSERRSESKNGSRSAPPTPSVKIVGGKASNSETEEEEVHIRSLGSGFWFRFLELQRKTLWVMGRIGIDGAGQESHQPWKWPLNLNTQKFCPNSPRAALVGSPFV